MLRMPFAALAIFAFVLPSTADAASTTLERIAESGTLRIGYVPDAAPLSFDNGNGDPAGYSIDLCRYIAVAVRDELQLDALELEFVPLNSMPERLDAVENGDVDIECGASTVTLSRRERVDFTLMTFITGAAILSRRETPVDSIDELSDQTIAVLKGTTTEDVMRRFANYNEMNLTLRFVATHDEGMVLLDAGDVDAYASDRAMLLGQIFRDPDKADQYRMSKQVISFEPYAMMTRRGDTEFRLIADRALASVYRGAQIRRLYQQWFGRYGEPLSPIVEAMYQFQAVDE